VLFLCVADASIGGEGRRRRRWRASPPRPLVGLSAVLSGEATARARLQRHPRYRCGLVATAAVLRAGAAAPFRNSGSRGRSRRWWCVSTPPQPQGRETSAGRGAVGGRLEHPHHSLPEQEAAAALLEHAAAERSTGMAGTTRPWRWWWSRSRRPIQDLPERGCSGVGGACRRRHG